MKCMRGMCLLVSSLFIVCILSSQVLGEEWPTKPIELTVTYSAGGATDLPTRIVTENAEKYLGQRIAVTNRPGAGGREGWNYMIRSAKKDGYHAATYNLPHFIAQSIVFEDNVAYNIQNMEPIANFNKDPAVLVAPKGSFENLDELVEYAKQNPGAVTVSGAGRYVGHHIAILQLEDATGAKFTYIPMDGGVPALKAVRAKDVRAGFNNMSDAYRQKDDINVLAIADTERNEEYFPDVPTFIEEGYDKVDDMSLNRRGIYFPKGVPNEAIEKFAEKAPEMFNDPESKKKMKKAGLILDVLNREEVQKLWAKQEKYLREKLQPYIE